MRVIVVGLGVQGNKRKAVAGEDCVGTVDPVNTQADYMSVEDVPLADYDAALVCVPDDAKADILNYLLSNGKNVLVEKPLVAGDEAGIEALETLANDRGAVCYTAYNHRFEPHFVRMRELIESGDLGDIYRCRMFYGNGTARLVRESPWRDKGAGVLSDLGSHLLDTARFWFGNLGFDFHVVSANRFENQAPDHVVVGSDQTRPTLELEMTLLMWRNHFTCDVFAEKGSAHISSLCKWGPATFVKRTRVLPSGRPEEDETMLEQPDPTWESEYAHFKELCRSRQRTDLSGDIWMHRVLGKLGQSVTGDVAR